MIDGDISFFYSDPKLKDVTFEYLVNGEKLSPRQLTSTSIHQVFGSNEFSVASNFPKTEHLLKWGGVEVTKIGLLIHEKYFHVSPI